MKPSGERKTEKHMNRIDHDTPGAMYGSPGIRTVLAGLVVVLWFGVAYGQTVTGPRDREGMELLDRVVASIGKEAITLYEVHEKLRELKAMAAAGIVEGPQRGSPGAQDALQELVDDALLLEVARRMGLQVSQQEVEQAISQTKAQQGWDEVALAENLRRLGFKSREEYARYLRQQMLRNKVIQYKVVSRVIVDDKDIEAEFTRQYKAPCGRAFMKRHPQGCEPQAHVWHIVFTPGNAASMQEIERLRSRAEEVRRQIVRGELSFEEAARRYSQDASAARGGDLGWFTKGEMEPAVDAVVFSLEPGEVSPVVTSRMGFHLFRVTKTRLIPLKDPEEARAKVHYELKERLVRKALDSFLRELRSTYKVELHGAIR